MRTFEVTQEDIQNGKPGDECNCPVALCLRRHFETVEVADDTILIEGRRYLSPDSVCDFVNKFDSKHLNPDMVPDAVTPFSFELDLEGGLPLYEAD